MEKLDTLDICEDCFNYMEGFLDALVYHYGNGVEYDRLVAQCEDAYLAYSRALMDSYQLMGRKLLMVHYMYDATGEITFTKSKCELCHCKLGGKRHHYDIVGRFNEPA